MCWTLMVGERVIHLIDEMPKHQFISMHDHAEIMKISTELY
ncbi:hypothetical protein [Salirhabdus salicampi]|nr:hypothetical protein [Salirhabdus salicampi]